jgi:ubiquinone/menaquinone biosynthesis C-methylase UbiE
MSEPHGQTPTPDSGRLAREAAFHDERFAEDTRAEADRFYAIARAAYVRYHALAIANVAGKRVLEYGCGTGAAAFAVGAAGGDAVGIDISPVAIEMARDTAAQRGVAERARFKVMNAEALDFPDQSFDRICGSGILHHLDLGRAYPEIARVLAPGGYAVFIEPLGHNPVINWYRRRTPHLRTEDEHPLLRADLHAASRHFGRVRPEFFHLATLAAVPLRGSRWFEPARRLLDGLDRALLAPASPLRFNAWIAVLVFER